MPDLKAVTAALATAGMVAQYFGFTAPMMSQSDANRKANWSARDQLKACDSERRELLERLLE